MGEKSTKFFLNFENYHATQVCLRMVIVNKKGLSNSQQINDALYNFYQALFKEKLSLLEECIQSFLDKVSLPKLNENQTLKCEGAITECELLKALSSIDNDKSPRNAYITKEFSIQFWDVVKEPLCASIQQSFIEGELSTSQKQAIIKLIEKKDRDKRFIKNWRPISLLNVDMKLISKVLASRLKSVISSIVNENQVAYVNNRFISESGRLISDVLEITNSLNIEGLLMTADTEKAFVSINHSFLMRVLKKFGFGNKFRK